MYHHRQDERWRGIRPKASGAPATCELLGNYALKNVAAACVTQKCKVKVRRVHDESIAFLTGNIYCICLDRDCQGHIVFARTDSTLNLVSIPYEIIHRVAFKEKCVRLVLDSTNVKGPCIELEFFDGADFQNAKNQIYTTLPFAVNKPQAVKNPKEILLFAPINPINVQTIAAWHCASTYHSGPAPGKCW